jgi:hypothetical protein
MVHAELEDCDGAYGHLASSVADAEIVQGLERVGPEMDAGGDFAGPPAAAPKRGQPTEPTSVR